MRTLQVHLMAMIVLIGTTTFVLSLLHGRAPPFQWNLAVAVTAAYVVIWLGLLTLRLRARRGSEPDAWRRHDRAIMWIGNGVTIVTFWLLMPFADDALRLMVVIFQFGPITTEVMGTVERPPARSRLTFVPFAIPLSTAVFFMLHWGDYSPAVILFSVAYAFVILSLRGILQSAVDRAYAARQTAEAALVQVAAERDAKTRFLVSASHDLGQPLQAARLSFDQAMRSPEGDLRQRAVRRVTWAFDATEQLLRRMLDHLRLESGGVEAKVQPVAIGPLIARLAEMYEPAARLAGVEVVVMPTRLTAAADPELLERILGNLVVNSLRHAKARRVVMGARRHAGRVRLWVIDDGVGILAADAPRLFEDYVQGSNHGDEIRGGFGLGLASAKRMADLMGGRIAYDAKWLNGSAFWVELPAWEAKAD